MVAVQLAAWREGFVPILSDDFRVPEPDEFVPRLAEALSGAGVDSTLAHAGERLVGWVTHGTNRDLDAGRAVGEVRAIQVHPDSWRCGVGSTLLEHALARLRDDGYEAASLWSFDHNARANAFYERHGFARDGASQRREFSAGALEVRYRRDL
jgi:GNAT superfamily N-acetyltransferase